MSGEVNGSVLPETKRLAPADKDGMKHFILECDQMLQDFFMEMRFRHQEYMSTLTLMHEGFPVERNVVDIDWQSPPEAELAVTEAKDKSLSFNLLSQKVEVPSSDADAQAWQTPQEPEVVVAEKTDGQRPPEPELAVTEKALKDTLFNELAPVRELKESVASMLLPVQRSVHQCFETLTDLKEQLSQEGFGQLQTDDSFFSTKHGLGVSMDGIGLDIDPIEDARRELQLEEEGAQNSWFVDYASFFAGGAKSSETMGQSVTHDTAAGLQRQNSHLNFAKDLLHHHDSSSREVDEMLMSISNFELPPLPRRGKRCCGTHEPPRTSPLAVLMRSNGFERLVSVVILFNAVLITYTTDHAVKHPHALPSDFILGMELTFQVFYCVELVLKLSVHRFFYFTNKDFEWNILDAFLVLGGLYDMCLIYFGKSFMYDPEGGVKQGFRITFLRVLRLLRLSKVIRIFRVMRFFSELNVLLRVVISTMRPLFWCTFMLMVFYYIFAVIFTHGASAYLIQDDLNANDKRRILKWYGSVWTSMVSLYKASTGGDDWGQMAEALALAGPIYYGLFLFFIAFVILALLNILTGLFVDRAMKGVAEDKDGMVMERLHYDRIVVQDLCRLFCAMSCHLYDVDEAGSISEAVFCSFMRSPVMRARLSVLDLEIWDSSQFFSLLTSISGTDEVDIQSFVTGCMQLRGFAKRLSMQAVQADIRELSEVVKAAHVQSTQAMHTHTQTLLGRQGGPQRLTSRQSVGKSSLSSNQSCDGLI